MMKLTVKHFTRNLDLFILEKELLEYRQKEKLTKN